MVKFYDLILRNRAIGMIQAGMSQSQVAKTSASLSEQCRDGGSILRPTGPWPRSGRPTSLSMVAKLVMKKAVGKRSQSATKLAQRLSRKGHPVSDRYIRRFWKNGSKIMGLKDYKIRTRPKLTEKQVSDRIKFWKGSNASVCHSPAVVPRQPPALLGERGVVRKQSRLKFH